MKSFLIAIFLFVTSSASLMGVIRHEPPLPRGLFTFESRDMLAAYIKYENYKVYPELSDDILDNVYKYSKEYNIPASLLVFLIQVESDFNPQAVSAAGAIGLMQVLPQVWLQKDSPVYKMGIKKPADLFSPAANIQAGSYILNYYVQKCNNDYSCALKKYFGGSYNSYVTKIKKAIGTYYLLNYIAKSQG